MGFNGPRRGDAADEEAPIENVEGGVGEQEFEAGPQGLVGNGFAISALLLPRVGFSMIQMTMAMRAQAAAAAMMLQRQEK